ncbi:hypothetical protein ACIQRS_21715 [Streptomyces termitum]|uniref:Secreted protein n=1 Tax=Streptomyces termitum TaxID=67368 RepID=A0A918WB13_9ACTN|nr:hypothetical protein [Streptomyces termitum]GHA92173.1 hypothetical protein GCM10010305_39830 [Streptomyces termitum]
MKKPTGRLAVTATAATLALTAVPASAVPSTTWTVTPSGGFTAVNRGNVSLFLGGLALTCGKSTASGRTQNATGNPAAIAVITGLFSVAGAAGELTVVSSSGCGTVAPVGAKPTFKGDYLVNPGGTPPIAVGTNP